MSEKFCLKWNDFHSNVSKSFGIFRNEEYLHDVTLVSDDHNKVPAHKLVLSACSEYFKDIFQNNHHPHPLLCLDGISSNDLKNILDYIYNGQVDIYPDDLDRFLVVAQRLKLEGLSKENDMEEEISDDTFDNVLKEDAEIQETPTADYSHTEVKTKTKASKEKIDNSVGTIAIATSDNVNVINEKVNEYMEKCEDGSYRCNICGKMSRSTDTAQKHNMMKHIETHMDGLTFNCPVCQKTFRSRNSLSSHKSQNHKN